jgi:hypothetical protein
MSVVGIIAGIWNILAGFSFVQLLDLLVTMDRKLDELVALTQDQAQCAFEGLQEIVAADEKIAREFLANRLIKQLGQLDKTLVC